MRRYFIGDLSQEEQERLEDLYLVDQAVFEELNAVEDDLIDSYVRGGLSQDETRKFEAAYLTSPKRRERVEFARALLQVAAEAAQTFSVPRVSLWERLRSAFSVRLEIPGWALAAAGLAIVIAGSWLLVQIRGLRVAEQRDSAEQAELRREADSLRQQIANSGRNPPSQGGENQSVTEVASLELPAGSEIIFPLSAGDTRRGGAGNQKVLTLDSSTARVRLQLELSRDDLKTYVAILTDPDGRELLRSGSLHRGSATDTVSWSLPARLLPPGDYVVQLKGKAATGGMEGVADYNLLVRRI